MPAGTSIGRSPAADVAQKWFPGHYVMVPPDTYTSDQKPHCVRRGEDGRLFVGLLMYVTLGQIETDRGVFQWYKIDRLLAARFPTTPA